MNVFRSCLRTWCAVLVACYKACLFSLHKYSTNYPVISEFLKDNFCGRLPYGLFFG